MGHPLLNANRARMEETIGKASLRDAPWGNSSGANRFTVVFYGLKIVRCKTAQFRVMHSGFMCLLLALMNSAL